MDVLLVRLPTGIRSKTVGKTAKLPYANLNRDKVTKARRRTMGGGSNRNKKYLE
jgi:hypothetical protein